MATVSSLLKMIPIFLVLVSLFSTMHKVNSIDLTSSTCPEIFKRYSSEHSYCQPPNASCEILGYFPTNEEQKEIVSLHNKYRSGIAIGQQGLPQATNMLELTWDNELATVAQKYADQCIYEHDCPNCRRVKNFAVGQNMAIQKLDGAHTVPPPDWKFAVNAWFSEIIYFPKDNVCPFNPPAGENEFRHFSQLIWAKTFRIGCGYVLYKTGYIFTKETLTRLYVCNYGPSGNVYDTCVYEAGDACSNCPSNSCCGSACSYDDVNPGLCRVNEDEAPLYPLSQPSLYYCNFRDDTDCSNYIIGNPNWTIETTLGGSFLSIVLSGGESSKIVFKNQVTPQTSDFCVIVKYRTGPTVDGEEAASTAEEIFFVPERNYTVTEELKSYDNPERQQFSEYNMTLSWTMTTELQYSFSVPPGKPDQFFNIEEILAIEGKCAGA